MSEYIKQIELVQNGSSKTIDIGTPHLIETTYDDLVELKNAGKLICGAWYRITDYTCTVNDLLAGSVKSAGHYFDILVLALTTNILSEECRAMKHDVDTHFSGCNLLTWKLWYNFDNDKDKYSWAHGSGKGVIYRMIDEFGNEAPYDFKNIMIKDSLNGSDTYKYTFNNSYNNTDLSLTASCLDNVIKPYYNNGQYKLNNIIISSSTNIHNNIFENDCYDIRLGNYSFNNTFGSECNNIKLGDNCSNNTFGKDCDYIYMNNYCCDNVFGDDCHYVVFGNWNTYTTLTSIKPTAKSYFKGIKLDSTVSYISLDLESSGTVESSSKYLNHIHIHSGVYGGLRSELGSGLFSYAVSSTNPILALNVNKYCQKYEINISLDSDTSLAISNRLTMWYI